MAFQDKTLTCRDCGKDFVWTASEQEFYESKGFQNAPVRCPEDRAAKKARMDGRGPRQSFEITCANCGKNDTVPFQPRGDKPVLCGDCFRKQKDGDLKMDDKKSDQGHDEHKHDNDTHEHKEEEVKPEEPKEEEKE